MLLNEIIKLTPDWMDDNYEAPKPKPKRAQAAPRPQRRAQEAPRPTPRARTAEPAPAGPDLSTFQQDMNNQAQGTANTPAPRQNTNVSAPAGRGQMASGNRTRERMAGVQMSPEAGEKLSFIQMMGMEDEISDEQAARNAGMDADADVGAVDTQPTDPTTLPAVISQAMMGEDDVNVEWSQVQHLPGYLSSPIRRLGRAVFAPYTNTSIEDIQVLANLGGNGPNEEVELNAVANFLKQSGTRNTEGEMNFQQIVDGYNADFKIYEAEGFTFMLVKDFAGNYIYSWPSADNTEMSGGAGGQQNARLGQDRPQLN